MKQKTANSSHRMFTLLERLAGIPVIAILAASGKAKENGKDATCKNNFRAMDYANDTVPHYNAGYGILANHKYGIGFNCRDYTVPHGTMMCPSERRWNEQTVKIFCFYLNKIIFCS